MGGHDLVAWRIETTRHFPEWQSAEGAFRVGGRWNSAGSRVLYASLDPSTAILEVAVHKGLRTLDIVPHVLLEIGIADPSQVHVVAVATVPNPSWLRPGAVSAAQQAFGDALLRAHRMVLIPSVVSPHSWNLLIDVMAQGGLFGLRRSEPLAIDPRLVPAPAARLR